MLDPRKAQGVEARIGFCLGNERFVGIFRKGRSCSRGDPDGADLVFTGAPSVIAAVIYGGQWFAELEDAGALRVEGDRAMAETFRDLFPLPTMASPPRVQSDNVSRKT